VISRQHRDLGGREHFQDGESPEPGHPACGTTDGPGNKSTRHPETSLGGRDG
jgi:hypothetical protein